MLFTSRLDPGQEKALLKLFDRNVNFRLLYKGSHFGFDIGKLFQMEEAAEMVGVPLFSVLPVKNYVSELSVDSDTDILLLSAVGQILHAASDAFEG